MKLLLGLLLIVSFNNLHARSLFGPRTLEDCILENMKGVTREENNKIMNASFFIIYTQFSLRCHLMKTV